MRTTVFRPALLALALASAPAFVHPAFAADGATVPSAHQGVAFSPSKIARARIVEPDGRVVLADKVSDLVAPSAVASRQARSAIAGLIRTAAAEKASKPSPTSSATLPGLEQP